MTMDSRELESWFKRSEALQLEVIKMLADDDYESEIASVLLGEKEDGRPKTERKNRPKKDKKQIKNRLKVDFKQTKRRPKANFKKRPKNGLINRLKIIFLLT